MRTIGYVRVSTNKQAERGCSLEAQAKKIRAMALVQSAELSDIIVESGESAKSLNRPGMAKLLALVDARQVDAVIIAKLDRLPPPARVGAPVRGKGAFRGRAPPKHSGRASSRSNFPAVEMAPI
jgi:predicted site-specific integrase-resolvase